MAKEILMPQMGMTMETGTIVQWYVKEGDEVEKGTPLFSVETDKAVLDVEAFEAGTILRIKVHENETTPVLACIGYIGQPGEELPDEETSDKELSVPAVSVQEESALETIDEDIGGTGIRATPRARALCAEKNIEITSIAANEKGIVTKKEVISALEKYDVKATPAAEKMAEEQGIDLREIPHEGRRIFKKDVAAFKAQTTVEEKAAEYMELSRVQKVAGQMLKKAWQEMPMVTNCIELDMTNMIQLVDFLNRNYGKRLDMKFSITDIMIKVLAQAMVQNPNANVYYEDGRLRLRENVHIGLAAATSRGLMVPVIRNADKLNIMEINREKKRLVESAREGKLTPDEMGGASTSYSNMGAYRAEMFTPIINYPESCIFGTGMVKKKAVVVNDEIVIRPMMWLNFTYDHRILDGEKAAKLLNAVKDVAEMPGLFVGYEGGSR